jgi:hypothetical protein
LRIAHFGTFDVEHYGDLLFPLILERRLSDIYEEFVHASPVGGPPVWGSLYQPKSTAKRDFSCCFAVAVELKPS